MELTNTEIIRLLSKGYTVREIAKETETNRRTIEGKILILRERCLCKTVTELVANYIRKKIID